MTGLELFLGKKLLITGGTGTFGNAVLRRLISTDIAEIRIFSRDEKKQFEMRQEFSQPHIKYYIGDVRNISSLTEACSGVDYIFHAAALKQVPSCEFYPMEAIQTNSIGADNVITAALLNKVKKVVMLSTDKAVQPINAMGLSKSLMEKILIARSQSAYERDTVLCCTRYGNVMGSRGSVIPLFIDQCKLSSQLTVTDPRMTRFMMSIDEAVDLVLYAFSNGSYGDIFVRKAPAATIGELANAILKLFNHSQPYKTIGIRNGEKIHEVLMTSEEISRAVDLGDYFRITSDLHELNYNKYFSQGSKSISEKEDYASSNTHRLSPAEITSLLEQLDFVQHALNT